MAKLEDAVKTASAELGSYHFVLEFAVTFYDVMGGKRLVRYLPAVLRRRGWRARLRVLTFPVDKTVTPNVQLGIHLTKRTVESAPSPLINKDECTFAVGLLHANNPSVSTTVKKKKKKLEPGYSKP